MANFRRNHQPQGKGGMMFNSRLILILLFLGMALFLFSTKVIDRFANLMTGDAIQSNSEINFAESDYQNPALYPSLVRGQLVEHEYFSLSYVEKYEQPEWVAYKLTEQQLKADNVERTDYFEEDPLVKTGTATYYDYKGSGYSKGHLVPSADRNFSREANFETFYMSNISPQVREFNSGVWNELEISIRNWTYDRNELYIVSGPLINKFPDFIGRENEIAVPYAFFKVLYDPKRRESIAYIIPNKKTEERLSTFAWNVDEVEVKTGIDFFYILDDDVEAKLESQFDVSKWPEFDHLYQQRVSNWNNQ